MRFGSCGVAVVAAGAAAMAGLARAGVEISEVMADNGKCVVTAGGVAGLDWVELRNTGSEAVDSIGWDNNGEKGPFAIYLRPGENSLTFRLSEYNGGDYLRVRFTDAEGRAITDITQSIMPTSAPVPRPAAAPRATALVAEDGKVRISLGNATKGVWYGYKFAEHLEDLKDAEVIWLDGPATADGVLPLEHECTTTSGFYRIVVE